MGETWGIIDNMNPRDPKKHRNKALRLKHGALKRFSRALRLEATDDLPAYARETIQRACNELKEAQDAIEAEWRNRTGRTA